MNHSKNYDLFKVICEELNRQEVLNKYNAHKLGV